MLELFLEERDCLFILTKEYFEALTILAAFEAISYSEDQHISLDSDYKLASLSTGLRLGFGYQF